MTSRRLPPPMNIMEGPDTTAPLSGTQDLIDKQKKELFSDKAAEHFGTEAVPSRVYTDKTNREKQNAKPIVALEQKKEQDDTSGTINDTFKTCVKACSGAAYDAWHFNNIPGNVPTRLHTIATRGGRGPYLMLTFVIVIAVCFCLYYCMKSNPTPYYTIPNQGGSTVAPNANNAARTVVSMIPPQVPKPTVVQGPTIAPRMAPVRQYSFV